MGDYFLVLNAGSSSLKFCVYQPQDKQEIKLVCRGQIEGIGSTPALKAKNAERRELANQKLDASIKDGHLALDYLAAWLRSQFTNAHVLGVGHRVVHGGRNYFKPTLVTENILSDLKKL